MLTLDRPADGLPSPRPQPRRRAPIPSAGHAADQKALRDRPQRSDGHPTSASRPPSRTRGGAPRPMSGPRRLRTARRRPASPANGPSPAAASASPANARISRAPFPAMAWRKAAGAPACDLLAGHPGPQARPTPVGPSGADRPKTGKKPALARRLPDHGCQHGGDYGRSCGKSLAPIAARRPRQRARKG